MEKNIVLPRKDWRLILQLFADDISGALAHKERRQVIILAEHLAKILIRVLKELGLEISLPKCSNFIVDGRERKKERPGSYVGTTYKQRKKEQTLNRMHQDVERIQSEQSGAQQVQLPFCWTYSFQLLGVVLDCRWSFHQHFLEQRGRLTRRLQALRKVSGSAWGLESRILATTAHALVESIVQYGLATTGAHASVQDLRRIDTQ